MKSPILSCAIILTLALGALNAVFAGSATWSTNPTTGDWNTAANWMPNTVPNGPADTATFASSQITKVSMSAGVEVDSIVFAPSADGFTINNPAGLVLTVSGVGVTNDSSVLQNFVVAERTFTEIGYIFFAGNATAGSNVLYDNGGFLVFRDSSTASDATYVTSAANFDNLDPAKVLFEDDSTAEGGIFVNLGGQTATRAGGRVAFQDNSMAGTATFVNEGGEVGFGAGGSEIDFQHSSSADQGMFIMNGGSAANATGGFVAFFDEATAGNAVMVANGGSNGGKGGSIQFWFNSTGGQARMRIFENGSLDISPHLGLGVSIGSIEGDGMIFLGGGFGEGRLTVGTNNLNTKFSGVIQDGGYVGGSSGSLTKTGTGTLALSGPNTYTGGTTIEAGTLLVQTKNASGTGTGPVEVNGGTLGGRGKMLGAVTIGNGTGTGAFLSPGVNGAAGLTTQGNLTFNADGTYVCEVDTSRAKADKITARGVTINSGAIFSFVALGNQTLAQGTVFTVINNGSPNPIDGTFSNLPDGSTFTVGSNTFQANYEGGNGNDLTLTVVP
jgi:autotransporter-associated beta strand protein